MKQQCKCDWLQETTENPEFPIKFDENTNEYSISTESGGNLLISFCPFCGGKAPKSKRDQLFEIITSEEQARLMSITRKINTVEEAFEVLGEPDFETSNGIGVTEPEIHGKPRQTRFYRTLAYHQLSDQAIVELVVYPEEGVRIGLIPKSIESGAKC